MAFRYDITENKIHEELEKIKSDIRKKYIEFKGAYYQFFEFFLEQVLELTQSEYSFIGEILEDINGAEFLKTYAIND